MQTITTNVQVSECRISVQAFTKGKEGFDTLAVYKSTLEIEFLKTAVVRKTTSSNGSANALLSIDETELSQDIVADQPLNCSPTRLTQATIIRQVQAF
jgi:hypothetical protein